MNKTFVTNTHIAPIVDVSTYEGPFSYESLWQPEEDAERDEGRVVCWDYDSKKMGERIVEEANKVFSDEKPLAKYGVVEIKATKFGSPREYNFMTDWLDILVTVDDAFFDRARAAILDPANRRLVVDTAVECWVSRDGFTSTVLDRIHRLSRDHWRHKHRGTHLSTDDEVYAAVTADVSDALNEMCAGTGDNEMEQMSVILKLLWSIEYPDDFKDPYWGWVADSMFEHIRGNSSLSEFCTVLDKDEIKARFGAHMIDFDRRRREFKADLGKYCSADFANKARIEKVCELFTGKVGKIFNRLEDSQLNVIANHATGDKSKDGNVNDLLDSFREEEVEAKLSSSALARIWGEASHEVQ